MRAAGNKASLSAVLASRRYWIELMFTPIAIAIGKLGAVGRLAPRARDCAASTRCMPLFYLGMAAFQYLVFKQGADIHVFWPHHFAAYFALACGALVATLAAALGSGAALATPPRVRPAASQRSRCSSLPLAAVLRDGVPALVYARETGGRFNEKGLLIDTDGAKTAFLRWLSARISQSRDRRHARGHEDRPGPRSGRWAAVW